MGSSASGTIIGNLGSDPETFRAGQGDVCNFSIAVNRRGKDNQDEVDWYRAVTFHDGTIKVAMDYLKKGDPVAVNGRLQLQKWEDRDGVERTTVEILISQLTLIGPPGGGDRGGGGGGRARDDARGGDRDRDRGGRDRDADRGRGGRDDRGSDRDRGASSARGGGRGRDDDRGGRDRGRDDDRDRDRGASSRGRDDDRGGGGRRGDLDDEVPF